MANEAISLDDMRELLRSHEEEIVNQVVLQPQSQNPAMTPNPPLRREIPPAHRRQQPPPPTTNAQVAELEDQIAQLQAERAAGLGANGNIRDTGMYNPALPQAPLANQIASGIAESVEALFPGVERSTLTQIIENRFKPTNIYRRLASERDRVASQRTITIGAIHFEQAERDGEESEYRRNSFFKAWGAYSGILVKLAPYGLQGALATALLISTMNLDDLLEKYTWDGVIAYHFQFHWKRVASGTRI